MTYQHDFKAHAAVPVLEHDADHKEVAIILELSCVLKQCAWCRLLRDETGSMTSSESSFSLITSSFTQRLQQWAQPSIRDVADDYHVTIWLGDLNYRYQAIFTPVITLLPSMCMFKHCLGMGITQAVAN
jgi:hypothetical protein